MPVLGHECNVYTEFTAFRKEFASRQFVNEIHTVLAIGATAVSRAFCWNVPRALLPENESSLFAGKIAGAVHAYGALEGQPQYIGTGTASQGGLG
jgi:hypothetical protein